MNIEETYTDSATGRRWQYLLVGDTLYPAATDITTGRRVAVYLDRPFLPGEGLIDGLRRVGIVRHGDGR
jgi:hypothetical protein